MNDKNIALLSMEKMDNREFNSVGSSRIRVRWLLNYWPEAEEYVIGKKYDVMIFQKVYWDKMMREFNGIKILDLCDPDWMEGKPVMEYVDMADAVTTSTQALADYMLKFRPNARILCIPDRVYIPEHTPIHGEHKGEAKSAVWFGYSHNTHYLFKTFDQLIQRGITLTIISEKPFVTPVGFSNLKVVNVPFSYPIHAEVAKHDFALLPEPIEDERGKFKSNNKVLQAWAVGLPVVRQPEDLDRFMSADERNKERELRLQEIKDKWDVKISVDEYKALIDEIKKKKGL